MRKIAVDNGNETIAMQMMVKFAAVPPPKKLWMLKTSLLWTLLAGIVAIVVNAVMDQVVAGSK